jgi:uncharacterized protein (DUF1330 family)
MATYLLAAIDVKDVARYDSEYISGVGPLIKKHGGRLLVASDQVDVREGQWPPGRVIVVEFPDSAAANAWYTDPDYQPLLKIRFESSDGILGFIDGV